MYTWTYEIYMYTCIYTIYMYTCIYAHVCIHEHMQCTYMNVDIHTCVWGCHVPPHTHTHTHTHIHTQIQREREREREREAHAERGHTCAGCEGLLRSAWAKQTRRSTLLSVPPSCVRWWVRACMSAFMGRADTPEYSVVCSATLETHSQKIVPEYMYYRKSLYRGLFETLGRCCLRNTW